MSKSISSVTHPAFETLLPLWAKVRDVIAGEEVVKARKTDYLPLLASQRDGLSIYATEQYEDYRMRAPFYGAAARTVQGLIGAILRKEATLEGVPDDRASEINDAVGLNYQGLSSVVMDQLEHAVSVGRYALLVDKGEDPESKPYVVVLRAEDVAYWDSEMVDGRVQPTTIAVRQSYTKKKDDDPIGNETEEVPELLVLRYDFVPEDDGKEDSPFAGAPKDERIYWQEVWREEEDARDGVKSTRLHLHSVVVPTKNGGRYWNEIPCDIVNAVGGIRTDTEAPPMLPLANCILAHYRSGADLEWGRHLTAIPQPWMAGFQVEEGAEYVVGSGFAWVTPDPAAKCQYLEFSGSGLGHLADGQREKEKQAAVLGSRLLEEQSSVAETMGTVRLRQSGDRSVLATIAHNTSEATTRAIQRYLAWEIPAYDDQARAAEVRFALSTDFEGLPLDPATLTTLTQSLQSGTISWETFVHQLRKGEMLPPGVTDEEERDRIQAGAPGRSRKEEAAMIQADVREGRISIETYLQTMQDLGYLTDVDIATERDRIFEEKAMAAEVQMLAFQQAGGRFPPAQGEAPEMGGQPPAAEPEEPEEEEPEEVPPAFEDEDENEDSEA